MGAAVASIDDVESLLYYLGYELDALKRDEPSNVMREQAHLEADARRRSRIAANRLVAL